MKPIHELDPETAAAIAGIAARFLVRFDDREGSWMFHCHILDHADGGLMGWVEVGLVRGACTGHPR